MKKLIALLLFSGLALTACSSNKTDASSSSASKEKTEQTATSSSSEKDQKKIEEDQTNYSRYLTSLREEEGHAREKLIFINQEKEVIKRKLDNSRVPGFSDRFIVLYKDVTDSYRYAIEELKKEPVVKNALDVIGKTSIIIHSIGNAFEMAERRKSSKEVLEVLNEKKAVSESFGSYFDENGSEIFKTSTIGMSFKDVNGIDNVFTIVGGEAKADAVYSYLNTNPANATLIIDEAICKKIIKKVNKNF